MVKNRVVELQTLRCFAIVLVVSHHVQPEIFPLGLLGVDIFFVLSGYLMAVITSRKPEINLQTTFEFMYRRLHRIVPICLISIICTQIFACFIVETFNNDSFYNSTLHALTFTYNIERLGPNEMGYGNDMSKSLLAHYWSLGVELQFYLVVPLFFFLVNRFTVRTNLFITLPILSALSITAQCLFPSKFGLWGSIVAFYSMPTRIWQFMAGIGAFYANEVIRQFEHVPITALTIRVFRNVFVRLSFIVLYGFLATVDILHDQGFTRCIVTYMTAVLIAIISYEPNFPFWILTNPVTTYIGDASYSIYLFHWIIIKIINVFYYERQPALTLQLCFALPSLIIYPYVERPLLQYTKPKLRFIKTCFLLYFISCGITLATWTERNVPLLPETRQLLTNPRLQPTWPTVPYLTARNSILAMHQAATRSDVNEKYTITRGTGNESVLLIGNSYVRSVFPVFEYGLLDEFSVLRRYHALGWMPEESNDKLFLAYDRLVRESKPDIVIFMLYFADHVVGRQNAITRISRFLSNISNTVDAFIVYESNFYFPDFELHTFYTSRKYSFAIPSFLERAVVEADAKLIDVVQSSCPNCIYETPLDAFCNEHNICEATTPGGNLPLMTDGAHPTNLGAFVMEPTLRRAFRRARELIAAYKK